MLAAPTLGEVLQKQSQPSTLPADQETAVCNANVTDAAVHPANLAADIALAMSAAPFTGPIVNSASGNDEVDGAQDMSDYGTEETGSGSVHVQDVHDLVGDTDDDDSLHTDSNDIVTVYDGVHSDLFEDLFQKLPINAQYRSPGSNLNGCLGPILLSDQDYPTALPVLVAHADD